MGATRGRHRPDGPRVGKMEHGSDVSPRGAGIDYQVGEDPLDVRHEVSAGEHDPFGDPGASGGEVNLGDGVVRGIFRGQIGIG